MRWSLVLLAACRYEPQLGGDASVAPLDDADDARPDAPPDAHVCPDAPSGCTAFACAGSSSCYYVCGPRSFDDAAAHCTSDGLGCIVTINDAAEDLCIFANTQATFPNGLVYFGYHQAADQNMPKDGWSWTCGTSSYTSPPWGSAAPGSEPNDVNDNENNAENCATLIDNDGWIDADCTPQRRYVCEL